MLIISSNVKSFSQSLIRKPYAVDTGLTISGVATKAGVSFPYARVWLINRRTGEVVNATLTDENGNYMFRSVTQLSGDIEGYIVLGFDDEKAYDPEAKDFVQPE